MGDVHCEDFPKARTQHKCDECRGVIQKGEQYVYGHGIYEGYPYRYKLCAECCSMHQKINRQAKYEEDHVNIGEMESTLRDMNDATLLAEFLNNKAKRTAQTLQEVRRNG